ncbi:Uncharacterised protein [Klebsiella pneumoniae]|mgnify:CR=1 FL=1|nr:Uncharacterised protein [Klebsiella pneumoniae]
MNLVYIKTDADAEAVFLNGHMIACFENDGSGEPISYISTELSVALKVQCQDFLIAHPDEEDEWSWDQLYQKCIAVGEK